MAITVETPRLFTCEVCDLTFPRPNVRGRPPLFCPDCRDEGRRRRKQQRSSPTGAMAARPGFLLAAIVTRHRLAIEQARSCLRLAALCRPLGMDDRVFLDEALDVLDALTVNRGDARRLAAEHAAQIRDSSIPRPRRATE